MNQPIFICGVLLISSLLFTSSGFCRQNLSGNHYGKVVQSTKREISRKQNRYYEYRMRIRLEELNKTITAIATVLKDSDFDYSIEEILNNTRYGNFTLVQRGMRYIVVFATPANRASISQIGTFTESYEYKDETRNNRYNSSTELKKSISSGNLEVKIGN